MFRAGYAGGEKKRLSVICGIARGSPILFLDEVHGTLCLLNMFDHGRHEAKSALAVHKRSCMF